MLECEDCKLNFNTASSLNQHKKTNKHLINALQRENDKLHYICQELSTNMELAKMFLEVFRVQYNSLYYEYRDFKIKYRVDENETHEHKNET